MEQRNVCKRPATSDEFNYFANCLYCGERCSTEPDKKNPKRWRAASVSDKKDKDQKSLFNVCQLRGDELAQQISERLKKRPNENPQFVYHHGCLSSFVSCRSVEVAAKGRAQLQGDNAFEVVVEAMRSNPNYIWNSVELHNLYQSHNGLLLSTRRALTKKILSYFGEDIFVMTGSGVASLLVLCVTASAIIRQENDDEGESDDDILIKAARILREQILHHDNFEFHGEFPPDCQKDASPPGLLSFLTTILTGNTSLQKSVPKSVISISQLITFNMKKANFDPKSSVRHKHSFEPPLPIFVGINIHAQTRSKKIVKQLYRLGISISYDRVMELENSLACSASERFEEDKVVCPMQLRRNLFTVGALDNLDHNASSSTAKSSFHGTGISLFQFPTTLNRGLARPSVTTNANKSCPTLPYSFTDVPLVSFKPEEIGTLDNLVEYPHFADHLSPAMLQEEEWVQKAVQLLEKPNLSKDDNIGWSAYHSARPTSIKHLPALSALLPLFNEKAASAAMIKHGMNVIKEATELLNPGQIPVCAFDQPLYALAKQVQWKWPATHGERSYVVMMGGLHIELALWRTVGDMLNRSGWTTAITEAGICSAGTADSFLKVCHLKRTR
jgi:hypothetical protein